MRKRILLVSSVVATIALFYWLFSHAYIEISLDTSVSGNTTYQLVNQNKQKISEISTASTTVKRLVRRGSHEVLVKNNEASYFAVVKTGGFLTKTAVRAKLSPEQGRQFVGNNPSPCMYYVGQTLFSSGCNASYSDLQAHVPATQDRPTFTQKIPSLLRGSIEGVAKTGEGSIIVLRAPAISEDQGPPHGAYLMREDLKLQSGVALADLDQGKTYSIQAYKEGFIAYDADFSQVFYYSSISAKPVAIALARPKDQELTPYLLQTQGPAIVIAYSNNTHGQVADIHDVDSDKVRTAVVIQEDDSARQFDFKKQPTAVRLCGDRKLCLLSNRQLEVYDISGEEQKLLFRVNSVEAIENSKAVLVVAREKEVLGFNVDSRDGFAHYSLGDYSYCGLQNDTTGYILCLINSKKNKVALRVSLDQSNSDGIDKKVAELLKLPEVKDISIYDKYLFVSPDAGQLIYNNASLSFEYDPTAKANANNAINQAVDRLGIDRNVYKIINPLQ